MPDVLGIAASCPADPGEYRDRLLTGLNGICADAVFPNRDVCPTELAEAQSLAVWHLRSAVTMLNDLLDRLA